MSGSSDRGIWVRSACALPGVTVRRKGEPHTGSEEARRLTLSQKVPTTPIEKLT